jgi:hypothetical protein
VWASARLDAICRSVGDEIVINFVISSRVAAMFAVTGCHTTICHCLYLSFFDVGANDMRTWVMTVTVTKTRYG